MGKKSGIKTLPFFSMAAGSASHEPAAALINCKCPEQSCSAPEHFGGQQMGRSRIT
ncbi:MAG TPA: hypothetical protein PKO16_07760 [Bacteroidia bacterium]|nr:hypothetical protein [Bacteroidia bacterium]